MIATAAMNEASRSAWCREHGVYPTDLESWKQNAIGGLGEPRETESVALKARDLNGCKRLLSSQLSNVLRGRDINRYRIAHSGRQSIILVRCEKVAIVVVNTSCVEHSVSGGRKRCLISTVFWAFLTEALEAINRPT